MTEDSKKLTKKWFPICGAAERRIVQWPYNPNVMYSSKHFPQGFRKLQRTRNRKMTKRRCIAMYRHLKKAVAILLSTIFLSMATWIPITGGYYNSAASGHVCNHGYYTLGDRVWIRTLNDRFYWRDPLLVNTMSSGTQYNYAQLVSLACAYWHQANHNILFNQDNSQPNATLEIWQKNNFDNGVLGLTTFWVGSAEVNIKSDGSLSKNYSHVKIYLSPDALNQYIPNSDAWQRAGTIVHELGHALGLSHRNNLPTSIMCQYGAGRTATTPSAADNAAVIHLYPNPIYK